MFPGATWVRWTALALLLLAALLRFWRLQEIPYTHDEISGLLRTGYSSFGELIRQGVAIDAHPPGVAVLLHYWTMLFGTAEGVVKAPFIILALLGLFLLYRFTLAWTNATVALLVLAFLATVQYTVMYAQIARPYAAGFFTAALLADQWTRYLAGGPKARRALAGTVIGFVGCAYVHHFALLFAGLVALSGLFLLERTRQRNYLLACALAVLLYLPNVPIFLQQLGYGGVGQWLAAPDKHWVPDYAGWVVQFHWPMAALLLTLIGASLWFRISSGSGKGPVMGLGLFWGLTPLAIGLAYSIWVDPVLQYSVLLFSFPFLLIALLHGLPPLKPAIVIASTGLVAALGVYGLVEVRQHYAAFYTSKYEAMVQNGLDALQEYGTDGAAVLIDAPDEVIAFQIRQWDIEVADFPHVQLRGTNHTPARLESLLQGLHGRVIAYGESNGAPPEQLARILQYFPTMLERHDLADGQVFLLSGVDAKEAVTDHHSIASATPDARIGGSWELHDDLPIVLDTVHGGTAWDYGGRDFGILLRLGLDTVARMAQDLLEVSVELRPGPDTRDVGLVLELKRGDSTVFYRTDELERARITNGPARLIVSARLSDAKWRSGPVELRAYLFNRKQAALQLLRMHAILRDGDPWRYGLFEDIPATRKYP